MRAILRSVNTRIVVIALACAAIVPLAPAHAVDPRALSAGTVKEKIAALDQIQTEATRVYLPEVSRLLDDPVREVRSKAADVLLNLGDGTCTDSYRKGMSDAWWKVRLSAVQGLVRYGEGAVLDDLLKALDDSYWQVRWYAATGIAKHGDERAVAPVVSHLKDENPQVAEELLWTLNRLLWREEARAAFLKLSDGELTPLTRLLSAQDPAVRLRAIWVWEAARDARAVPLLVRALDDPNTEVRVRAMWALEQFRAGDARFAIERALADPEVRVRLEAVKTLVRLNASDTVNGLVSRLSDPDEKVRIYALWALERMNDPRTYPDIARALNDPSARVRGYAESVISHTLGPRYAGPLLTLGTQESTPPEVRRTAFSLVARAGDEQIRTALRELLAHPSWQVRQEAVRALAETSPHDGNIIDALCFLESGDASSEVRQTARALLGREIAWCGTATASADPVQRQAGVKTFGHLCEARDAIPLAVRMARSEYPEVRLAAAQAARRRPDARLAPALRDLLDEQNPEMQKAAALGLGAIGDAQSAARLKKLLGSYDAEVRLACAWALARTGHADGVQTALSMLTDPAIENQKLAVETLVSANAQRSLPLLMRLVSDSELEVKALAAWAVARLGEKKGAEVLVALASENIEPIRSHAASFLEDPLLPAAIRAEIPAIRSAFAVQKRGIREVIPKTITAYRTTVPIEIDGRPDDRIWLTVQQKDAFISIDDPKSKASAQTRIAVVYDEKNIYFLVVADDPQARSLSLNSRDFITVSLNPSNTYHEWYQFVIHPFSLVKYCYVWKFYRDSEPERSWAPGWKAAAAVSDTGWSAEIAVPLTDMRAAPDPSRLWGFNVHRESDHLPHTTWTGRIDRPDQFGTLLFGETP